MVNNTENYCFVYTRVLTNGPEGEKSYFSFAYPKDPMNMTKNYIFMDRKGTFQKITHTHLTER